MNNDDLEKIMDKWSSHEIGTAPEIKPTEEVYQKVRAKQSRARFTLFSPPLRWATASIAIVAVILFAALNTEIFQSSPQAPGIGLRKGISTDKSEPLPARGMLPKRSKKGPADSGQLFFHYQRTGSSSIESIDIQNQLETRINLTPYDNYRFAFQLSQERYIYIYQLDSEKRLIKLLPNKKYSSLQNPLQAGQVFYCPQTPNWFYLENENGEEIFYILETAQPRSDLDRSFEQYIKVKDNKQKQVILQKMIHEFESIKLKSESSANLYEFKINN